MGTLTRFVSWRRSVCISRGPWTIDCVSQEWMKDIAMSQPIESNAKEIDPAKTGSEIPATGERRREPRRPVELGGVCEFGDKLERINCKVLDISNSGAQLSSDEAYKAPEYFRLYILPLNMVLDCRVMWRKENRMGVYFLSVAE